MNDYDPYFEDHGGYEYAKKFYEEAFHFIEKKFGADNIVSAVMHADELNTEASEMFGKDVYHYHLHAMVIPVVDKDVKWSNFSLIIRQMLEFAVDSEIVKSNEFLKVKVDKKRVLTPERKKADHTQVFNKTEEQQIIRHAWDVYESGRNYVQRFVPLGIVFMFYTGLRVSELSALKFSDVEGNTLTVQRMLRYSTGEVIDGTKGTFGDRQVPLTDISSVLMKSHSTPILRSRRLSLPTAGSLK